MKPHYFFAMQQSFQSAAKRLVFISDISGTLIGSEFEGGFNQPLFDFLIKACQHDNWVMFTTNAGSLSMFEMIGDLIRDKLREQSQPEKLFDVAEGFFNKAIQPLIPKENLECFLGKLDVQTVDCVFDDEFIHYLPEHMVGQHVDPKVFATDNAPSREVVAALSNRVQSFTF